DHSAPHGPTRLGQRSDERAHPCRPSAHRAVDLGYPRLLLWRDGRRRAGRRDRGHSRGSVAHGSPGGGGSLASFCTCCTSWVRRSTPSSTSLVAPMTIRARSRASLRLASSSPVAPRCSPTTWISCRSDSPCRTLLAVMP